jgi:hypothetical protein
VADEDPFLVDVVRDPLEQINRALDPAYTQIFQDLRERIRDNAHGSYEPPVVPRFD